MRHLDESHKQNTRAWLRDTTDKWVSVEMSEVTSDSPNQWRWIPAAGLCVFKYGLNEVLLTLNF